MDISQIAAILAPLVPYLIKGGLKAAKAAAEKLGEKITEESWDGFKALWGKIRKKAGKKLEALDEAAADASQMPNDPRAKGALELQLEKILKVNPDLAKEAEVVVGQIVNLSYGGRSVIGPIERSNVITGDRSIIAESGSTVNVGDASHTEQTDSKALLECYYHRLVDEVGWLNPAVIDRALASDATRARLSLAQVYTDLDTLASETLEYLPDKQAQAKKEVGEPRRLPVVTVLNRKPKLVLLGDPGSGKSTFLNFVALCMAGSALGLEEANLKHLGKDWQHGALLPVRVVLRDFVADGLSDVGTSAKGDDLWRFIEKRLGETLAECAPLLKKKLQEQGGIILLDGFDEVPEAEQRREQVTEAVQGFASDFPRCRFVLTSRTYAWQRQNWGLPGFTEAVLAPFNNEQINVFIDRWYDHISILQRMSGENAKGRATLLKLAIEHTPGLHDLAQKPLLLTLIASLHAWRGGNLPEKRELLYNDTIDLLLNNWEQPKIVRDEKGHERVVLPAVQEWLKAPREQLLKALEKLAYTAHSLQQAREGTADLPENELVQALWEIRGNPDLPQKRIVEYIRDRAGLLVPHGVGVYTFPHRTFQEYLAARYLTETDWPEALASCVRQDPERWREAALLASSKAARGASFAVWALVEALIANPDHKAATNEAWAAVIAGQILEENELLRDVPRQHQAKVNRLRHWLKITLEDGLLPSIERAAAGDTLARLGDPRPGTGCSPSLAGKGPGEAPRSGVRSTDFLFCEIPAGKFLMGSKKGEPDSFDDEYPQFSYDIKKPYYIARYPVTNAQFDAFVDDPKGYRNKDWWTETGRKWRKAKNRARPEKYGGVFDLPNHPVVNVSWYEAVAFANWLDEQLKTSGFKLQVWRDDKIETVKLDGRNWQARLPTEAEWEKAARGAPLPPGEGTGVRVYPWGNDPDPDRANYDETGIGATSAVGCFPKGASPYGLLDMSGNVWEWCATQWLEDYKDYRKKEDNDPKGDSPRVVRGGAFLGSVWYVRCAYRFGFSPGLWYWIRGFRVVVSPVLNSEL